jgi:hypothetical protein
VSEYDGSHVFSAASSPDSNVTDTIDDRRTIETPAYSVNEGVSKAMADIFVAK